MSKVNFEDPAIINHLHSEFPAVGKSIIQNEIRKNNGDLTLAMKSIRRINEAITQADQILGEEEKQYIHQDDSDEDMESSNSSDSDNKNDEGYHSQDEKEAEETDAICQAKVNNYIEENKTATGFVDEQSEEFFKCITDDLVTQFPGVPTECVKECVKYFYPNMGKIEHVLQEFQKHWVEYNNNYDEYKGKRKDRKKRSKKDRIEVEIDPQLAQDTEEIQKLIDEGYGNLTKVELKALKHQLKGLKKRQRTQRKELKRAQKDERRALKDEAKRLKKLQKDQNKAERSEKKLAASKARGDKDYQDDVFFKEIREEPTIIKQYLKEAKKSLRKAERKGDENEIQYYKTKIEEYEKSLEEETDKVIELTYARYNRPDEHDTRLDLHGLKKAEALRLLEKILLLRIKQINEKYGNKDQREPFEFNIVTGSGNHSRRPVLKPAVRDFLLENSIPYKEFSNGAGYVAEL